MMGKGQPVTEATLTPTIVEGEIRIKDTDLGARLGFTRPAKVRELIDRYRETLSKISVLPTVGKTSSDLGGRPSSAFYLDRKQAIFITMKSETEIATEVTLEIIERFDAYELPQVD